MGVKLFDIQFSDGQTLQIKIAPTEYLRNNRHFIFSLHKAGSSLLTALLLEYTEALGIPTINLPSFLFQNGKDENTIKLTPELKLLLGLDGYCYLGWRNYMDFLDVVDLDHSKNILLVRDPRDRLISYYFSITRSHVMPSKGDLKNRLRAKREESSKLSVDRMVTNLQPKFSALQNIYHCKLRPHNTRIYRYEDVIYRKEEWLEDMVNYLDFPHDPQRISNIARQHDIHPEVENPEAHIRQVKPGNHKRHLKADTIRILNLGFDAYLRRYGYMTPESFGARLVFAHEGREAGKILAPLD